MNQMYDVITEEMFYVLDTTISVPIVIFKEETLLYFNKACCDMFDYSYVSMDEIKKLASDNETKELYLNWFHEIRSRVENRSDLKKCEFSAKKKNGDEIIVEYMSKTIEYKGEACFFVQLYDITEKRDIEYNLMHLSKVRELMLEISQSVVEVENINKIYDLILRNALNCIENADLGSIFTFDGDFFRIAAHIGFSKDIEGFVLPKEASTLYKMTDGKMDQIKYMGNISLYDRFYPVNTKFGESRLIKSTMTVPIRIKGELFGMINVDSLEVNMFTEDDIKTMEFIRNCVEIAISNQLLYEKAKYLSKYDALTDMYNRTYFNDAFAKIEEKYTRRKDNFWVVVFDLDRLKWINDYYGHHLGDAAIKKVAFVLKRLSGGNDFIARVGGDEFCGVYFQTSCEELKNKFENCLEQLLELPCEAEGQSVQISFSYGIAQFPEDGSDFTELSKIADERMYKYKKLHSICRD
ncbi:MAG: diguanylate cyclase [Acetivibrio sp.]